MGAINSQIDVRSETFQKNREGMLAKLQEIAEIQEKMVQRAEKVRWQFEERGQLMPRERLNLILDKGAPFIELMALAGYQMHDDKDGTTCGGSYIGGIGFVSGIRCVVLCSNSAIKGGAMSPSALEKTLRAQQIARENKLPMLCMVESAGANLEHATDIFTFGGRTFRNQAQMSAMGLPQVTIIHGSCTAGGAYLPGLSDYVVLVRGRAKMFLAGPPLLKAATGEIATDEELGGADMHVTTPGTSEYIGENDRDAIRICRELMATLPWNEQLPVTLKPEYDEPLYSADELAGVVPMDYRQPYDCREIIARIADGSVFFEFKEFYDSQTICGHSRMGGRPIGIIGNNGPINYKGATKAAQFIQLCCQSNTPLLYLQNTTGFMVGKDSEQNGIIKHGSKMIQAVSNASVPQITILVGGGFGAGNYGMCGRAYDPRLLFAWPSSRVAVMGGEQAAMVLDIVAREKAERLGQGVDEEKLQKLSAYTIDRMTRESEPLYGTARLWDDGLIDPRDTRKILIQALEMFYEAGVRPLKPNSYGVARF
ncbi:MAG: acyl-CoA carboxylase subunit beta [Gammaproteobacteria bacterium]|nr:acyl-CoA carboxylase subunit beta [Gammaproteobacteria bacterium]